MKSNCGKTRGHRTIIFFAYKVTGERKKFTRIFLPKSGEIFWLCLFICHIVSLFFHLYFLIQNGQSRKATRVSLAVLAFSMVISLEQNDQTAVIPCASSWSTCQSSRNLFWVLPMSGRMSVCVSVCVSVCPFDYSHTVQPRALKFWDMGPRVIF